MTSRRKVALLGSLPADVPGRLGTAFDLIGGDALSALTAAERAAITHGLTSAMGGADRKAVADLPNLSTIVSIGAGMDRFDLPWLAARGIAVHPTPDVMTEDTAEFAVGLLFALLRNIVVNDRFMRSGDWAAGRARLGWRLSGRQIGIVGLGRIGSRIAAKLTALDCAVSYTGRSGKDVPWQFVPDLADLARTVDGLVLSCAGGEGTQGLVDARILDLLGPQGYLVNVSRGSVVDESALIAALQRGSIAGAALDVFATEPTPNPQFFELSNCILEPHVSVYTHENRRDLVTALMRLLSA